MRRIDSSPSDKAGVLESGMAQTQTALRGTDARQGKGMRLARRGGFFPLTPALSLGERVSLLCPENNRHPSAFHFAMLAVPSPPRERVRMRGNGVKFYPAFRTNPGIVELDESSSSAVGFTRRA